MVLNELPQPLHQKKYFYRGSYPNIYRDDRKGWMQNVVSAYDSPPEKTAKQPSVRIYDQLWGGLRKPFSLPKNFPALSEPKRKHLTALELNGPLYKEISPFSCKRKLITLSNATEAVYIPSIKPIMSVKSDTCNLMLDIFFSFTRPDFNFVKETQKALVMWFQFGGTSEAQITDMCVNPGLVNLKVLWSEKRDTMIRHLASTVSNQKNIRSFTFENAFLDGTEGIRILLAIALGAGNQIKELNLMNLFFPTLLPIELEDEYFDVYNEYEPSSHSVVEFTDDQKVQVWEYFLEQPYFDCLSPSSLDKYFLMTLSSLSQLTVLKVNYTWFSKGNGRYLLHLESIRNGNLRKLYLYLTPDEQPKISRQVICYQAWKEAATMCPQLELHLILGQNAALIDFNQTLVRNMPLVSIHFASIHSIQDAKKQEPASFSYMARFLRSYFSGTLSKQRKEAIFIEMRQQTAMVDISIANLLRHCFLLEVFDYKGHLDKFDTINSICAYLVKDEKMRLVKLGFHIVDDPCRPIGWSEAIMNTRCKYEKQLERRGIQLSLGIWKI